MSDGQQFAVGGDSESRRLDARNINPRLQLAGSRIPNADAAIGTTGDQQGVTGRKLHLPADRPAVGPRIVQRLHGVPMPQFNDLDGGLIGNGQQAAAG